MIDQLLSEDDKQNAEETAFKMVKIRLMSGFFCSDDSADQPIFNKSRLSYDKHQLAKIISYQHFQLLFRPFKNHTSFKNMVKRPNLFLTSSLIYFLLMVLMLVLVDTKKNAIYIGVYLLFSSLLLFAVGIRSNMLLSKAKKQLREFCGTLRTERDDVSFRMVQKEIEEAQAKIVQKEVIEYPQKAKNCLDYIYVYSNRVLEDNHYIKLYQKSTSTLEHFWNDQISPIIKEGEFQYDREKLDKIISFENFQQLLRPFKRNYYYQRLSFWYKFTVFSFSSFVFVIFPLLIWINHKQALQIIFYSYLSLIIFLTAFGLFRAIKMKSQMLHQLKDYCFNLSLTNLKIEIVVHLTDTKEKKYCSHMNASLFCFEIRHKEQMGNIME